MVDNEYLLYIKSLLHDYCFSDTEIDEFLGRLLQYNLYGQDWADQIAYLNNDRFREAFYQYYDELVAFGNYYKILTPIYPLVATAVTIDSVAVSADSYTITVDQHS